MFNISKTINSPVSFHLLDEQSKISMGQGEYVVFHVLPNNERKRVTRETFELANQILNRYAPAAIVNRNPKSAIEECSHRFEIIKSKIKEIDPSLEIAFIPRTLYEMVFIRKCIREDVKNQELCKFLDPINHDSAPDCFYDDEEKYNEYLKKLSEEKMQKRCWHLCHFDDEGDNDYPEVRDVAFRLNQTIIKSFSPPADGFTFQELSRLTEKEIEFLKGYYKKYQEDVERCKKGEQIPLLINCSFKAGPTINFGCENNRGHIKPMGIRHGEDAQILSNAVVLECSKIAEKAFLLYRGANFKVDAPYHFYDENTPYHLSYGSSLFAGCVFDGGATAFHYMRNQKNAYAIPVPFDQLHLSPFYIPPTRCVPQLFGDGEVFHGRTRVWKGFCDIEGICSDLSKEMLITQFKHYKKEAIQLK